MIRFFVLPLVCLLFFGFTPDRSDSTDWKSVQLVSGYHEANFTEHPLLNKEEQFMLSSLGNIAYSQHPQFLLKENGQYFALNHCDLNAWKWENGTWKKLSDEPLVGYNCTPYIFLQKDNLWMLSGSGYWQNQLDLFRFLPKGGVEYVPTSNQPEDYRGNLQYQTEQGIYSLFGVNFNIRTDVYDMKLEGYFLDLSNLTWSKVKVDWISARKETYGIGELNPAYDFIGSAETDSYALIEMTSPDVKHVFWLIIDKKTNQIYQKDIPFLVLSQSKWLQVSGNSIRYLGKNSLKSTQIDLVEMVKTAVPIGKIELVTPTWFDQWQDESYPLWVGIPLVLMIFGGWWLGFKRPKEEVSPSLDPVFSEPSALESDPEIPEVIKLLFSYAGQTLSQDQMDLALGIWEVGSTELRKVKRSRAIKGINKWVLEQKCNPMVVRVRDVQDNRIIKYEIHSLTKLKMSDSASTP